MKTRQRCNAFFCGARAFIALLFPMIWATGCGGPYQSAPVNIAKAQEVLITALDSWKNGDPIELLQSESPAIVVQDFDWMSGLKLLQYEVLDDENPVDANLVSKVKLSLQDRRGNKSEKSVIYHVGTAPVLTVFRAQ